MGYSLYRHGNEAIGFLLEGSSVFDDPKDSRKENQPISLRSKKKKSKQDGNQKDFIMPQYEYVVKSSKVVEENVPSESHIDMAGLGSLQVSRPVFSPIRKAWSNNLKNRNNMKASSSTAFPSPPPPSKSLPAVVMMPRQVLREKSGRNKEEIKLDPLLELRPTTRAGQAQKEVEEGEEKKPVTIMDELSRELWFPKRSGDIPPGFKDLLVSKLEDGINKYIGKRREEKHMEDNSLQLHMASLEAGAIRKLLSRSADHVPPNTADSRVQTPDNMHIQGLPHIPLWRKSPKLDASLPYIMNKSGPVNMVLAHHHGISTSATVTVSETIDVPVRKGTELRNEYAKNLEKNWLRTFRIEQRKKRKDRRVAKWVQQRVNLKKEDFSRAFYSSDEEMDDQEDEVVFDVTLRDIMTAMTVSEHANGSKSDISPYVKIDRPLSVDTTKSKLENTVLDYKVQDAVTFDAHGEENDSKWFEGNQANDSPAILSIHMPSVQNDENDEPVIVKDNSSEKVPDATHHELNQPSPVETASTDINLSENEEYDHDADVKLLRYASMDVLFSDATEESDNDIQIKLGKDGPYNKHIKYKTRKMYHRSRAKFEDILYDSDEDHGIDKVEEEVSNLTDVEIRAMRLKLLKEDREAKNTNDFQDMSAFAAGIMKDLNKLNKKKKKKKKNNVGNCSINVIPNLREKFLLEYGHLLQKYQQDDNEKEDSLELPRENTAKFLESVSDDINLVRTMSALSEITTKSSVWSGQMRKKWKRKHNMKSPYKKAKKELMVFPNRSRLGSPSSTTESMNGRRTSPRRMSVLSGKTLDDDDYDDVRDIEIEDFDEIEELEFIKAMAKRRFSYEAERQDCIVYDKYSTREKTEDEKEAERKKLTAEREARRKQRAKTAKKSTSAKSSTSLKSQISQDSKASDGTLTGKVSRSCSFAEPTEEKDKEEIVISDFVTEVEEVSIDTSLPERPNSACGFPKAWPEIDLNDLLAGIDFPAKQIKIAIVYRRRKRQRQRAAQRLAERESRKNMPLDLATEVQEEPAPPMTFNKDAPFMKACLSWNQRSNVRNGFTDEELDEELQELLGSELFRQMQSCRWIRWNKSQQAAIERLWELELCDERVGEMRRASMHALVEVYPSYK